MNLYESTKIRMQLANADDDVNISPLFMTVGCVNYHNNAVIMCKIRLLILVDGDRQGEKEKKNFHS